MDNQKLAAALSQLKDIHLPSQDISAYPPAPIYYIFALIILFAMISLAIYKKHQDKIKAQKYALKELKNIRLSVLAGDDLDAIQSLSILLRQSALTAFPRIDVASINGHDWLAFLDNINKTNEFTNGCGRILITAPFQKDFDDFPEELLNISQKLIKKLL